MYCGTGRGKSASAMGRGVQLACEGKKVFLISFLKGKKVEEPAYLKRLEPEFKTFTFDKFSDSYDHLSREEKREETAHVQNGLNYARKVLVTGECDLLILDEILDLARNGIITQEDLIPLIDSVPDGMELIMTGTERCEKLWPHVDKVTEVTTLKESALSLK